MRTIEVYHHVGDNRQLISRMWFLSNNDFHDMATRLMAGRPSNSQRYDRHEVCQVLFIYRDGFESGYYTDGLPSPILNICTEYVLLLSHARKMAERRGWLFAWLYAYPEWQHRAILKQMRRASKLLQTPPLGVEYR